MFPAFWIILRRLTPFLCALGCRRSHWYAAIDAALAPCSSPLAPHKGPSHA